MSDTIEGYTIAKFDRRGWTLTDPDGDHIMVAGFGHISPTYRAAVVERQERIEANHAAERIFQERLARDGLEH